MSAVAAPSSDKVPFGRIDVNGEPYGRPHEGRDVPSELTPRA